jgi:epoxyqueuosine reductase QueG
MLRKEDIIEYAENLGAVLIGFAPASRWRERKDIEHNFFPDEVWTKAKTVIVMSIPSLLPIVETKISDVYREQYDVMNSRLDEMAYQLAVFLNKNNCPSIYICRDGYGNQSMLRENPRASFSHVWAGYYAGLGTIGWNQTLITTEFGPRHRLVSVLTSVAFEGDDILEKDLCTGCGICVKMCPDGVYTGSGYPSMDKIACANQSFAKPYNHCGFCIKTCPIGEDRKMYGGAKTKEYQVAHEDFSKWVMGYGGNVWVSADDK